MDRPRKERHNVSAPAFSPVETMSPTRDVRPSLHGEVGMPQPHNRSNRNSIMFMLPILATTILAAVIAVLPLQEGTAFALFCGEIGSVVLSIVLLAQRH